MPGAEGRGRPSQQRTGPLSALTRRIPNCQHPGLPQWAGGDGPLLSSHRCWHWGAVNDAHLAVETLPSASTSHKVDTGEGQAGSASLCPGPLCDHGFAAKVRRTLLQGCLLGPQGRQEGRRGRSPGPGPAGPQTGDPGLTTHCCHSGVGRSWGALATPPFEAAPPVALDIAWPAPVHPPVPRCSLGSRLWEEMHSRTGSQMPRLAAVGRGPSRASRAGGPPPRPGPPAASELPGTPPPNSSR